MHKRNEGECTMTLMYYIILLEITSRGTFRDRLHT